VGILVNGTDNPWTEVVSVCNQHVNDPVQGHLNPLGKEDCGIFQFRQTFMIVTNVKNT